MGMNKYIDLHLHLDGSVSENTVRELCRMQKKEFPHDPASVLRCPENCKSLNDYLKCFDYPLSLLQSEEAITHAVSKLCSETDYRYCEIRFAPVLHTRQGLSQREIIKAACKGLQPNYKIILCCMRGMDNEETVRICTDFMGNGVVALDLAGAEALYPTVDYKHLFEFAAKEGIPYTIHAGEADGAQSVRDAVNMGASRIGHGIRAIEDPSVVNMLAEYKIPLEMCPTSNLQTQAVKNLQNYPILHYINRGIPVTINSDNMTVSATDVSKELELITSTFSISKDLLLRNAQAAAFIPMPERKQKNIQ